MPDATMASTDADMMESDMVPQTPQELTSNSDQGGGGDDAVRDLLTMARQLIDQGKPSQSLQAVKAFNFLSEFSCFYSFSTCFFYSIIFL